jgi:hypothetical protein
LHHYRRSPLPKSNSDTRDSDTLLTRSVSAFLP